MTHFHQKYHTATCAEDLEDGITSSDPSIRAFFASHKLISSEQIRRLAQDPAPAVRDEVLQRYDVPADVLVARLEDVSAGVRCSAAAHMNLPVEHVIRLWPNASFPVRKRWMRRRDLPPSIMEEVLQDRVLLAHHIYCTDPVIPEAWIEHLYAIEDDEFWHGVSGCPIPDRLWERVFSFNDYTLIEEWIENNSSKAPLSPYVLGRIVAEYPYHDVQDALIRNTLTPKDVLVHLAQHGVNQTIRDYALKRVDVVDLLGS